jgi:hypothetical protein
MAVAIISALKIGKNRAFLTRNDKMEATLGIYQKLI